MKIGIFGCGKTPEEAAREGEVVLLTIPLGEVPKLSQEIRDALKGKTVLDTCNPYPERDGPVAQEILDSKEGTGRWTAKQFPGARIVRAFNSVHAEVFESQAYRNGDPVGVPLASDDDEALKLAGKLVRDAGFGPVVVGKLNSAKLFDHGSETYGSDVSDKDLRQMLFRKEAA